VISRGGVFGDSVAAIRADPRVDRLIAWIANKEPDFYAPTHGRR
jgi:hypothetical protein